MSLKKIIPAVVLLSFLLLTENIYSQENTTAPLEDFYSEFTVGYHHYNVKGYRGKVGEYDVLDTGIDGSFLLEGRRGRNYFDMTGEILDEDDQHYTFNVDLQRIFQTTFSYQRFRHFLDHDPLNNQDFATDFDPDHSNGLTVEEIKSLNTFRLPILPFLKFRADYRKYSKRGHRQATTVSKCSQCHVSSRNKRVDANTEDITFTMEANAGPATIQYSRLWRTYQEDAMAPLNDYGTGASFFPVQGNKPYSRVPDSSIRLHEIKVRSDLPFSSSFFASYQVGEKTNKDTRNDIDFNSFATRLSNYLFKYCSVDVFYSKYNMDKNYSDGIETDLERGGFELNSHLTKKTSLKFTYQWDDTDRDNFSVGSTNKKIYRLTFNHRPLRRLRLHIKYEKTKVDDPFILEDRTFLHLVQTSLPQNRDEYYISISWNPRQNFSLNSNFRYIKSENNRYDVDEDRYEFIVSVWYIPFERLTLTGSYTIAKNEVDTPVSLKTYHMSSLSSLFIFNDIPYDDRSQSFYLSASYLLNQRISLTGELTYTTSVADFDTHLGTSNIGELSDLDIHQVETSVGITYLYSNTLSLFAKYMFRDYNDREENFLDGQFNAVSFGLSWTF